MKDLQMGQRIGQHVGQEVPGLSRDGAVFSGGFFVSGEVVGKTGATYTKLNLDPEATESKTAEGVSFGYYDASEGDAIGLVNARLTSVNSALIVWPETVTDAQKLEFIGQLEAKHIILR